MGKIKHKKMGKINRKSTLKGGLKWRKALILGQSGGVKLYSKETSFYHVGKDRIASSILF